MKKFILSVVFISFLIPTLPANATTNIRYSSSIARMHSTPPRSSVAVSRYGHNSRGRYVSTVSAKNHQIKHGYTQSGKISSDYKQKANPKSGYNAKGKYIPVSEKVNVIKYGYDSKGRINVVQVATKYADD